MKNLVDDILFEKDIATELELEELIKELKSRREEFKLNMQKASAIEEFYQAVQKLNKLKVPIVSNGINMHSGEGHFFKAYVAEEEGSDKFKLYVCIEESDTRVD